MLKKIKCKIGMHSWTKFMGPKNIGGGKFAQSYKCLNCGKIIEKSR